eukprot:SAG11_NODE_14626_length_605_cov_1.316206_2_plen_108_part_00
MPRASPHRFGKLDEMLAQTPRSRLSTARTTAQTTTAALNTVQSPTESFADDSSRDDSSADDLSMLKLQLPRTSTAEFLAARDALKQQVVVKDEARVLGCPSSPLDDA